MVVNETKTEIIVFFLQMETAMQTVFTKIDRSMLLA